MLRIFSSFLVFAFPPFEGAKWRPYFSPCEICISSYIISMRIVKHLISGIVIVLSLALIVANIMITIKMNKHEVIYIDVDSLIIGRYNDSISRLVDSTVVDSIFHK